MFYSISGRMGNTKQALDLIVNELRDVSQAIDFCKEQNDEELWEDLIDYSLDKPCMYITAYGLIHVCACVCVCASTCIFQNFTSLC